jgi:hypothetical protein
MPRPLLLLIPHYLSVGFWFYKLSPGEHQLAAPPLRYAKLNRRNQP